MVVCDLTELDLPSIDWMKGALFLDVSKEEASVLFRREIEKAKDCGPFAAYRPTDNIAHIWSDRGKEKKL